MGSPLVWWCFLCVTKVTISGTFVWTPAKVLPVRETWMEGMQNSNCHLLGRELINDRVEDVRVQGVADSTEVSTEYWIGAHVQYTKWMRLKGCFQINVQQMTLKLGNYSITECHQFCVGASFGLSVDRCACLDTPGQINEKGDYCMAVPCPKDDGEFCGEYKSWSKKCLCWYDILDLSSDNKIGNCKTLTYVNRIKQETRTAKCSERHSVLCGRKRRRSYNEAMNWTEAGFTCHRDHRSQFYNGRRFNRRSRPLPGIYWVGMFRKQLFSWGNSTPSEREFDCLSASVDRDGKLNTFVRKCYSRLPLFCDQPEPKITLNFSTTVASRTFNSITTVDSRTEAVQRFAESGGLSVFSFGIGVVCGIFVTLLAVVIFVIIYRYKKQRCGAQTSGNRQEVACPDIGAVHYEHIRPENRENQMYDVCGQGTTSYDYITTQGDNNKLPE